MIFLVRTASPRSLPTERTHPPFSVTMDERMLATAVNLNKGAERLDAHDARLADGAGGRQDVRHFFLARHEASLGRRWRRCWLLAIVARSAWW